jgi:hypothetical protein
MVCSDALSLTEPLPRGRLRRASDAKRRTNDGGDAGAAPPRLRPEDHTDSVEGAEAIVRFGREHGQALEVWIEVDVDGHRSGVVPDADALLTIGRVLLGSACACVA